MLEYNNIIHKLNDFLEKALPTVIKEEIRTNEWADSQSTIEFREHLADLTFEREVPEGEYDLVLYEEIKRLFLRFNVTAILGLLRAHSSRRHSMPTVISSGAPIFQYVCNSTNEFIQFLFIHFFFEFDILANDR